MSGKVQAMRYLVIFHFFQMFWAKGMIHLNKNSSMSAQDTNSKNPLDQSATTLLKLEPVLRPKCTKNLKWWFFIWTVQDLALWIKYNVLCP